MSATVDHRHTINAFDDLRQAYIKAGASAQTGSVCAALEMARRQGTTYDLMIQEVVAAERVVYPETQTPQIPEAPR